MSRTGWCRSQLEPRATDRPATLATAILDRLLYKSHVLNIKGRSYRLRDIEQAMDGRAYGLDVDRA